MDGKEYLQADFDANTLKVAELRGILNEYGIKFASNSKKKQLVNIFNKQLKPRAEEYLKQNQKSVENYNDKGFVDVKRGEENVEFDEDEEEESETPKEEEETESDFKEEDENEDEPKSVSKTSKTKHLNETEEKVKINEPKSSPKTKSDAARSERSASPFTNRNVFQTPDNSIERQRRKRTLDGDDEAPPKKKRTAANDANRSIFDSSSDSEEKEISSLKTRRLNVSPRKSKSSTPSSQKLHSSKVATPVGPRNDHATPKQDKKTPSKTNTPNESGSSKSKHNESEKAEVFQSLKDEEEHFNKQLEKIRGKKQGESQPIDPLSMASQLGVTIQGVPKKDFELKESKFDYTKSPKSPTNKTLNPRRRTIPSPKQKEKAKIDGDDEDERNSEKNDDRDDSNSLESENTSFLTSSYLRLKGRVGDDIGRLNDIVRKRYSLKSVIFFLFVWIILISGGLVGFWFREQTILVGFCGQEVNRPTFPDDGNTFKWLVEFGNYLDSNFKPSCIPCPPHARCFPNLELGCYEDFYEWKPWYSFINPTSKRCIPDTKKAEKLEIMIDVALDLLRTKNANRGCGTITETDKNVGISVSDLHEMLLSMKAPYITTEEFEELWSRAIIELEKEPEIITRHIDAEILHSKPNLNYTGPKAKNKILRSTSLSHISLKCKLQNSVTRTVIRFKYHIAILLLFAVLIQLAKMRYRRAQLENARIEIICKEVIKKLIKQKVHSGSDASIPSYIGSNQLRDLILGSEHNLQKRSKTWEKITSKVENNTNVRSSLNENHGEIMKVWEWISDLALD